MQRLLQGEFMDWLLFLYQLPSNPSSLRVASWRKMRGSGALGLQNSTWILPYTPENERFLLELLTNIRQQDANAQIFRVLPLKKSAEQDLLMRFQIERDQEYSELCERCRECLAEIEKETKKEKFTFAELEEIEDNLEKLKIWLKKIQTRDFSKASKADESIDMINQCQSAFIQFSQAVYAHESISDEN